jgi:hypothetical protein
MGGFSAEYVGCVLLIFPFHNTREEKCERGKDIGKRYFDRFRGETIAF